MTEKVQELAFASVAKQFERRNLPSKYRSLVERYRQSSSDINYYTGGSGETNTSLPTVDELDKFVVVDGDKQPSVSIPEYREILEEVFDDGTCITDFWTDKNEDISSINTRLVLATCNAFSGDRDKESGRFLETGHVITESDTIWRIMRTFQNKYCYGADNEYLDYLSLFRRLKKHGEITQEDIFYSNAVVCGWKVGQNISKRGTYFSDPRPVVKIKSGELPFYLILNIAIDLWSYRNEDYKLPKKLFTKGGLATKEDITEQIWSGTKRRPGLLHLTEFTDTALLSLGDMIFNPDSGMTFSEAISTVKEVILAKGDRFYEQEYFEKIQSGVSTWDNFVLGVDESRILRLTTSANSVVREGASTAIILRSAVASGEAWKTDANIANAVMSDFGAQSAKEIMGDEPEEILKRLSEIGIESKRDLLTKDALKKIFKKLENHKSLIPKTFSSAVRSGIRVSREILNDLGIEIGENYYDMICDDPSKLIETVDKLKKVMMLFHPEAQIRHAELYKDPVMKKMADEGHIALKNLYHWYDTVRVNYKYLTRDRI